MTVSHAAEDAVLGGERTSDGLWTHRGKLVVRSSLELAAPIAPTGGSASLVLPPGLISTAALAPNAIQQQIAAYRAAVTVNTTTVSSWIVTSMATGSIACSGVLTRFEVTTVAWHSVATGVVLLGLAADGALYVDSCAMVQQQVANQPTPVSFIAYATPAAGSHTFALALFNMSVGTANLGHTFLYTTLYVTEQKR
jgi:hypothetical protein